MNARRFLLQRGWPDHTLLSIPKQLGNKARPAPADSSAGTSAWQPLGPVTVSSLHFGAVSGRITSIAFDPADVTGNRVFVGTTGGGVWVSQNAGTSNPANVVFSPLTDSIGQGNFVSDTSISVGAVSVQPGGTGVVLAGTGDPNDALDSYYGGGILRSTDGGSTWNVIGSTADLRWSFAGEGFAGFAWSTANPQLVVAAVSQSYEGTLVDAEQADSGYEGLYYSTDSGATWALARITDGVSDVQGPNDVFVEPHGNAATAVVWNPVRKLFIAAVRYHGYYQSSDGNTWTRMASQPSTSLSPSLCPTNSGIPGSTSCPIFRGSLAVNPATGDTFAWTVDGNNQDQGIWQDKCSINGGVCGNPTTAFTQQWATAALDTITTQGAATVANGDYTLVFAAVSSGQDTLLMAGDDDVWKCSLIAGCAWHNTTNTSTCISAKVAPYQHALAWNAANPLETFIGNDSGLWRSTDDAGESGSVCDATDASHFQNLNGTLGSLAEVDSLAQSPSTPFTLLAGLGANGTSGIKNSSGTAAAWPQILDGEGGTVAIDPADATRWFVNNQAGVAIYLCAQSSDCTPSDFGTAPVVTEADVANDGITMTVPATFAVDPLDLNNLLVATCRVWRGPTDGSPWTSANAISPFLDGAGGGNSCNGDALIRTIAAMPVTGGREVIYAGMYGSADGGASRAGHIFRAAYTPGGTSTWTDLTFNPVTNEGVGFNADELDISSIAIDPHDASGNTVYVTVAGISSAAQAITTVYMSGDGGAHWAAVSSNLPETPANAVVVDPEDANTVYVGTDVGVYSTRQIAACASGTANCWTKFGSGLPASPVVTLSASASTSSQSVLLAGTYGRGVWMTSLWTAGTQLTTATANPSSLAFSSQLVGTSSAAQALTLINKGTFALEPSAVAASGDFTESDDCAGTNILPDASCTIQVTFTPSQSGARAGTLTIDANVSGGEIDVPLTGTGTSSAGTFGLSPASINFGQVQTGSTSTPLSVSVNNNGNSNVTVSSVTASAPFMLATNACGSTITANSSCQIQVTFSPAQAGAAAGTLEMADSAGTQTVLLSGSGAAGPTDTLSPTSLTFSPTVVGQTSAALFVLLNNSGDLPLNTIAVGVAGPFQAANGCGGTLAAHSSCTISMVFAPMQIGAQAGSLTVSDTLRTQTVTLAGTGIAGAVLSAVPVQLAFGEQALGSTSQAQTVTLKNTGGSVAANIGFQISGSVSGSFAVAAATCGATLAPGGSCSAQIIFLPQVAGSNEAALTVSSSTLGVRAVQVALSGTGEATAGININPAQMSFSVGTLGQPSTAQTATVTNRGTLAATGLTLVVAAPFSLITNSCGSTLAPGSSCTTGVIFTPTTNGFAAGTLTVESPNYDTAVLSLTGSGGRAGSVSAQPTFLGFAVTGVGKSSEAQSVTFTNTGSVALTNLTLGTSGSFPMEANSCGSSLAAGASCTIGVAFAPKSAGQQSGTVTLSSSELAGSVQVPLSGTGFDFRLVAVGTTAQTVASGQTVQFEYDVTPLNGSSGTFSFSCSALPSNSACSFSPASLQVGANNSESFSVDIDTGQPMSTAGSRSGDKRLGIWPVIAPVAFGLILFPVARRRQRSSWWMAIVLCFAFASLSGCAAAGGNSASGKGNGGASTPPGTYTISVTATANGLSHSKNLTLTVD